MLTFSFFNTRAYILKVKVIPYFCCYSLHQTLDIPVRFLSPCLVLVFLCLQYLHWWILGRIDQFISIHFPIFVCCSLSFRIREDFASVYLGDSQASCTASKWREIDCKRPYKVR